MALSELHRIVENAHDLSKSTRDHYLHDLDRWIAFAGTDPAGWTRRKAAQFYLELLKEMKPQSANRLMAALSYASRWWATLENNEQLHFAIVQSAKPRDKKPQHALTAEEAAALLATCDASPIGVRDFALLVVGLETGMRRMSLEGMQIEDTLLAPTPRMPYAAARVPLKGAEPDWVPLSDTAVAALRPWLVTLAQIRREAASVPEAGPVFRPLTRGPVGGVRKPVAETRALSRSAIAKMFDTRAAAAKLRHLNPHILRHTFVTWRTAQGLQPHEIAAITHHDLGKAIGALGGYMDLRVIGGNVRNRTPAWLAQLVAERAA